MDCARPTRTLLLALAALMVAGGSPALGQTLYFGDGTLERAPPLVPTGAATTLATEYVDGRPLAAWQLVLEEGARVSIVRATVWIKADLPVPVPPGTYVDESGVTFDACTWSLTLSVEEASQVLCSDAYVGTVLTGEPQRIDFLSRGTEEMVGLRQDRLTATFSVTPAVQFPVAVLHNGTRTPSLVMVDGLEEAHGHAPPTQDARPIRPAASGALALALQAPAGAPSDTAPAADVEPGAAATASERHAPGLGMLALLAGVACVALASRWRREA